MGGDQGGLKQCFNHLLQDDISKLGDETKGQVDFLIVIPSGMIRTYR
jgi:hypothetical protein